MSLQVNYIYCQNANERYKMVYYTWGEFTQDSKVLLCLHGLNSNGRDWDFIAEAFAKKGYYVIAPDIVGRGNSDYLNNVDGYDLPNYCTDILQLLHILNVTQVNLLGTSMGGIIGMVIASMPSSPLVKLILNDIGAEIEYAGLEYIGSYATQQPSFADVAEANEYFKTISTPAGDLPEAVWLYVTQNSFQKNMHGRYEFKRDVNLSKPFVSGVLSTAKNIELWDYWHKVKLPTLVIRGQNSALLAPQTIVRMRETNNLLSSVEIPNTGHAPFLYSSEHIRLLSDFLQGE